MPSFKYAQLQSELLHAIDAGVYSHALPSVRTLAKAKGVSISTIQKAYQALELTGHIYAKPQKGYFVRKHKTELQHDYGIRYKWVSQASALEKQVLHSLNDDQLMPLSSTAPSSVLNNAALLSKHHKKSFDTDIYRFHIKDEVQGCANLRQAISQLLYRQGSRVSPDDIQITTGRREGLLLALAATGAIGGTIAIESPSAFFFRASIARLCKHIVEVPMKANYADELMLLEQAHSAHGFSAYLVNPSFNDPTGRLLSTEEKLALLHWAARHNITLIEYDRSELHFGCDKPPSLLRLANQVEGVCVISIQDFFDTVSTRICLGFVISKGARASLLDAKHTLCEEPSLHTQQLMHSLIVSGDYEKVLQRLRQQLFTQYLDTQAIMRTHKASHIQISSIAGGPCLWLKSPNKKSHAVWRALIKEKVAIAPGSMFSFSGDFDHYLRITYALPWNLNLVCAIQKVVKAL